MAAANFFSSASLVSVSIFFLAFTGLSPVIAAASDSGLNLASPPLITVTSVAEKSIDPTIAILQIEVYGKAKQAKVAQELQAKEYARLKSITEKYKIKKEDFLTQDYNIQPEYTYDQKTQNNKVTGYRSTHRIKLVLRKIELTGELLDAVSSQAAADSAGASIQSIEWDSDKKAAAESAAMTDAVKIAKQKAEDLASVAGVKIKSTYSISHGSNQINVVRPQTEMRSKAMSLAADYSGGTEVSGQSIKVRAEVTMQFLIRE